MGRPTVVALGASAGGLAVFERFFGLMSPGGNLAFLLVTHLDPAQKSLMPSLLAAHTELSVAPATDGMRVEADHVYVIPPNVYMTLEGGVIRLAPITGPRSARFPIDVLLRSLAEDQGERAVAVIFSGTGADGTDGLRAIKEKGGTVLVQDPRTVEYAGMPESAIATGLVDFVVPVERMPDILRGYARHAYTSTPGGPVGEKTRELQGVFDVLRGEGAGLDYGAYKPGTLTRRVHRRMGLARIDSVAHYVALLRKDPEEVARLRRDLLITATHFFRDPRAWETLEEEVIPRLFRDRSVDAPVRVWVAGCSTGEEAYTLAMLLLDRKRVTRSSVPLRVFATDVDPGVLEIARAALYDRSSVAHIPPARLKRYFRQEGPNAFRATKELRDVVTFAVHNILADPPFSRMDVVTCRNLLIYLSPQAQAKILGFLEFSLRPEAFLFLGPSESLGPHASKFTAVAKDWRIFRHVVSAQAGARGTRPARLVDLELPPRLAAARPATAPTRAGGLQETLERWLVERYAPAAVIIDPRGDILHIHGALASYLELSPGEPTMNLLSMAPTAISGRLRVELHKSRTTQEPRELTVLYKGPTGKDRQVRIRVAPLGDNPSRQRLAVVTFEPAPGEPTAERKPPGRAEMSAVRQLESELAATRGDLQGTIEQLETANEELRASNEEVMSMNEEIMSMNEEFRSTNEELESSKEELQSINEELNTVNNELREKYAALEVATGDLDNLLASTDIPTLFLDTRLRIRRFADLGSAVFNLVPTDVGRPLGDVALKVDDRSLVADVQAVMRSLSPSERHVATAAGRRYVRRARAYRTMDGRVDGAVVVFVDVEAMQAAEDLARRAGRYAEEIVETVRVPLLGLDAHLDVLSANRAYCEMFRTTSEEVVGRSVFSLAKGVWNVPSMRAHLEGAIRERTDLRDVAVEIKVGARRRTLLLNTRRFPVKDGGERILLAMADVTASKASRDAAEAQAAQMELVNKQLLDAYAALDAVAHVVGHDLKEPARAVASFLTLLEEDHAAELQEGATKLVTDARAANERLIRLLAGLLALSQAGRIDQRELGRVGVAASLASEACASRYEAVLAERHATLEPPPETFVRATPELLAHVLGDLVLNAIQHNPAAAPHVRVRAGPAKEAGMTEVVVEDDGPGFPPEMILGFERMSATTRGFGLLIVRRTVESLGGRMWLGRSQAGGGEVHLTLVAAT